MAFAPRPRLGALVPADRSAGSRKSTRLGRRGLQMENLEERRMLAGGPMLAGISVNDGTLLQANSVRQTAPKSLTFVFDKGQTIDTASLATGIRITRSGLDGVFGNANDVAITPGFAGLGQSSNEVIVRFAETLADDVYQIDVIGSGVTPLKNIQGQPFNMGIDFSSKFELNLAPQVVAVVPQPITRQSNGQLTQSRGQIIVYFNNDDLNPTAAANPDYYQLIFTGHSNQFDGTFNTATNTDDSTPFRPTSVVYDAAGDRAILTFASDLATLGGVGTYRLRVGTSEAPLVAPNRLTVATDAGSSFATANTQLGTLGTQDQILVSAIEPQAYNLIFPGSNQDPGHRDVGSSFDLHVPENGADIVDGVTTISYNFRSEIGRRSNGTFLPNAITNTQKDRAREAFELWGNRLGVKFVETPTSGFTIATGDLRAIDPTAFTDPDQVQGAAGDVPGADANGIPFGETAVMNNAQRWNDEYGENYFQEVMTQIGHLLGLGAATDLPTGTVMSSNINLTFGREGEAVYPGNHDVVHGQYLYRPDSNDIDMYQFVADRNGILTVESFAERLTTPSGLDTQMRLYRRNGSSFELVAQNDDYFSQDSLISVPVSAGTYFLGVSSKGNDSYNPAVQNSGAGGISQGNYELRVNLRPTEVAGITDATGIALDGDGDGTPGGAYQFWFRTQTSARTLIVDKAATTSGTGTLTAPFKSISAANTAATSGDIVRVVGNNFNDAITTNEIPYELGFGSLNETLADSGPNGLLEIKKGVTLMVDAGAVFKLRSTSIIVGSSSTVIDRSGAALQILGTPGNPVKFTSFNDETIGQDKTPLTTIPRSGDWGGIVFRNDIDRSLGRYDHEKSGIFLNYVNNAEIAYGGGILSSDSVVGVANPITMVDSRPSVTYNRVRQSADAAMSASPDAFEESRFTEPAVQNVPFTLDYNRVGPEIHHNTLTANTTNAMVVANQFLVSARGDELSGSARWNDTDIVHVISDNLIVTGNSGGLLRTSGGALTARLDGRLAIDPGVIVKVEGAYIDIGIGANFLAEGTPANPIVITSLQDDRYGAGGSFNTNGDVVGQIAERGDWGGVYLRPGSLGSLDQVVLAYGGGVVPIEGSFTAINPVESHQGDLRVTRSLFEFNASGTGGAAGANRGGRTPNADATIYVAGGQPIVLNNRFLHNDAAIVNIDVNSMNADSIVDIGRSTGTITRFAGYQENQGPLVRNNIMGDNGINGMEVRGGTITTEVVWDDTDVVHVLRDGIYVPNFHSFGGVRLKSAVNQSLVVKMSGPEAGFTTTGSAVGIPDHIGGSLQIIGQPGYPVVMTSLFDDTVGAGFDANGITQTDTNGGGRPTRVGNNRPFKIDFNFGPLISQNAAMIAAIRKAADAWEEELSDEATIVIDIETGTFREELFNGTTWNNFPQLFDTTIDTIDLPYSTVRNAMVADAGAHEALLNQLPSAAELNVTLPDETLGAFGLSPNMRLTRANAKAIDLPPGTGVPSAFDQQETRDGQILVNQNFDFFDLDRKDGLLSYREDLQTVLMREIGTILGFRSGVDQVTAALQGAVGDGAIQMFPLDLFRFAPGEGAQDFRNAPRTLDPRQLTHVFYAGDDLDFRDLPFEELAKGDIPLATGFRRAGELNDAKGAGFWRDDLPLREEEAAPFKTIGLMDAYSFLHDEILYALDPNQTTEGILVNISEADRLAFDSIGYDVVGGAPGDWQGIRLEELTHDGNVPVISERETADSPTTTNSTTSTAQFLGQIAVNEKSGDENIRLGFEVQGVISQPSDVDVYSFKANGGTTVYMDIDRTGTGLDTVLELISPDGTVIARSDNSTAESADPTLLVGSASPLDSRDIYTTNVGDAAMKVTLPGISSLVGTYHVRVRSSGSNLANLTGGQTTGRYQMQIRLQSEDEVPGTSIELADIRYAETGITIVGPPSRSALGGEQTEDGTLNDVILEQDVIVVDDMDVPVGPPPIFIDHSDLPLNIEAQDLGNVLATRQGAISVFGSLAAASDVDWYRVEFTYGDLQPSFAQSFFNPDTVGVVFDIDYADGFGRPDTTLSVFNDLGQLILYSESSNVAADLPAPGQGADLDDLSRGSASTADPFIGPVVLTAGREITDLTIPVSAFGTGVFYVAVSSVFYAPDPIVGGGATREPIGADADERGEFITGTNFDDTLFDLNPPFPNGAVTEGEYSLEVRTVKVPSTGFTDLTVGDSNRKREQGSISISSNQISFSRNWGITMEDNVRDLPSYLGDIPDVLANADTITRLSQEFYRSRPHAQYSTGDYIPHTGAPRALPTINEERQIAGITIANNVISGGLEGGLQLQGDPGGVILTLSNLATYAEDLRGQVIGGSEFTLWDHHGKSQTFQFEPADPGNIPIRWDLDPDNDGGDIDATSFATSVGGPTLARTLGDEIEHAIRRSSLDIRVYQGDFSFARSFSTLGFRSNSTIYLEGVAEIGHPDIFGGRNSVFIGSTPGESQYPYFTAEFAQQGAVPYVRVVNNTLFGRGGSLLDSAGNVAGNDGVADVGILVEDNISPTLLNNIVSNYAVGIRSDLTSTDNASTERRTFVGAGSMDPDAFRVGRIRQSFLDDGNIPIDVRLRATGWGLFQNINGEVFTLDRNLLDFDHSFTDYVGSRPTVIAASVYQGNLTNTMRVTTGDNAIMLANSAPLFVDPSVNNFFLKAGSRAIDSSVDRLGERNSYLDVAGAVGIDSAGILAPATDALGVQRVDDPAVEPPGGVGQNVFKDRGALERADFVGPIAGLVNPVDNDNAGQDRNPAANEVALFGTSVDRFDIRFSDTATPANPTFGTGVDDAVILPGVVRLFRDATELVQGTDYIFTYDVSADLLRLTSITGIWLDGEYRISLDNTKIRDRANNALQATRFDGSTALTEFRILLGEGFDFGDARASYGTLSANDGARHRTGSNLYLGAGVDLEAEGKPSEGADQDAFDDGVTFSNNLSPGNPVTIDVVASLPGVLNAWIDLNGNGTFEASDRIFTNRNLAIGVNSLTITVPSTAVTGQSFARFRFSSQSNLGPTGVAQDGEVEDYSIRIGTSEWQNPADRYDVNRDGIGATPLDALLVINELTTPVSSDPDTGRLNTPRPTNSPYYDVNGDGFVSPLDALLVINQIPSSSNRAAQGIVVTDEDDPRVVRNWRPMEETLDDFAGDVARAWREGSDN